MTAVGQLLIRNCGIDIISTILNEYDVPRAKGMRRKDAGKGYKENERERQKQAEGYNVSNEMMSTGAWYASKCEKRSSYRASVLDLLACK